MFNNDIDIYPPPIDYIPQSLCVRPPCSLQIIQLVECSPPPPQHKYIPSISSSSYCDSDSDASAYDSSSSSLSAASSYCSSAEDSSAAPVPPSLGHRDPSIDDTYRTRQRRVNLWRDAVYSKNATSSSGASVASLSGTSPTRRASLTVLLLTDRNAARPASPCQKRKTPEGDSTNNDPVTSSHSPRKSPRSTLSAHSCPACDEDFSSPLGLRQHASTSRNPNEACRIAVEYGFE
ncbi:hypothetical protein F5148DRAFT_171368 [Russula earlei]|uniref:Uncharacterized protein n=1 Tax=Russula earlei TaxID=71964 RepID=A0ACC0U6D2_9AGAM|nr:hypothetical protein F5148DRAFT_171368 [Russula earlei]